MPCSSGVSFAGLRIGGLPTATVSILSSTVAKVRPASFLRSGAGRNRLTPTSTTEQTTNMKRSEEHTSELQSRLHLVCRLLLEKKKSQISVRQLHLHTRD